MHAVSERERNLVMGQHAMASFIWGAARGARRAFPLGVGPWTRRGTDAGCLSLAAVWDVTYATRV